MVQLQAVQVWRENVDAAIAEVDKLISIDPQKIEKLCVGGCCSKHCVSSFIFDRKVNERLEDMVALYSRNFDVVMQWPLAIAEDERPTVEQLVALETMLGNVWRWLVEDKGTVQLWGMGGIGKITFLKQTNRVFELICIMASSDFRLDNIYEKLMEEKSPDEKWLACITYCSARSLC